MSLRVPPNPRVYNCFGTLDRSTFGQEGEEEEGESPTRPTGYGRILYVITSFDRGRRLGREFKGVDKLDYVLMMMDEMREACEVRALRVGSLFN